MGGSVLLAAPIALAAGLISFFSPCVLVLGWWTHGMQWAQIRTAGFAV